MRNTIGIETWRRNKVRRLLGLPAINLVIPADRPQWREMYEAARDHNTNVGLKMLSVRWCSEHQEYELKIARVF